MKLVTKVCSFMELKVQKANEAPPEVKKKLAGWVPHTSSQPFVTDPARFHIWMRMPSHSPALRTLALPGVEIWSCASVPYTKVFVCIQSESICVHTEKVFVCIQSVLRGFEREWGHGALLLAIRAIFSPPTIGGGPKIWTAKTSWPPNADKWHNSKHRLQKN